METIKGVLMIPILFASPVDPWQEQVYSWPLIGNPTSTLIICATYYYFFKNIGPKMMQHREPFNLKSAIFVYNIALVIINSYIFYGAMKHGWASTYSWSCQPFDPSPNGMPMNRIAYLYFLTKFVDLFDSLFFLLTGKLDHLNKLHLIHHSVMPIFSLWGMKRSPNGHGTFAMTANAFIHIIMYSYYALSIIPSMKPYLWWKKYLTQFQMIQFTVIVLHMLQIFLNGCDIPRDMFYLAFLLMSLFLFLFADFYSTSYVKKSPIPFDPKSYQTQSEAVKDTMDLNANFISSQNQLDLKNK